MKNFVIDEQLEKSARIQIESYKSCGTDHMFCGYRGDDAFIEGSSHGYCDGYRAAIDQLVLFLKQVANEKPDVKVSEILKNIKTENK